MINVNLDLHQLLMLIIFKIKLYPDLKEAIDDLFILFPYGDYSLMSTNVKVYSVNNSNYFNRL